MTLINDPKTDPEIILSGVSIISGSGARSGDMLSDDSIQVRPRDLKDPKTWRPEDLIPVSGDMLSDRLQTLTETLERLESLTLDPSEDPKTDQSLTLDLARDLSLGDIVYSLYYRNADQTPQRYRINGKVKTWKTRPEDIKIPVKRGLYEFGYLTPDNLNHFSLSESFAGLVHSVLTDRERLILDLESITWRFYNIGVFLSDHIRDFRSVRGHPYMTEDLTDQTRHTLENMISICQSLESWLERLIRDLETGDPETLETLRSSHVYISDIFGDPETWRDPDILKIARVSNNRLNFRLS